MTGRPAGNTSSSNAPGFTLLELLVAITLLGLVFTMMAGGLRFGATVWERGGHVADANSELQLAQTILRRRIEHMVPARQTARRRKNTVAIFGDNTALRFVGNRPGELAAAGSYLIQISEKSSREGKSLALSWRRLQSDFSDIADRREMESTMLMRNIEALEVAYFGSIGNRAVPQWHRQWQNQETLPKLIRIIVAFAQGDRRVWPTLYVAPQIDGVR